ncbi:hypothetical protein SK128_008098 [Halocaridina rubra]|uniref:Uncharacterized protein n=1 Tax=Halocaridina rubra TaxID=373956 RepID=A0AAN8XB34_HALRR
MDKGGRLVLSAILTSCWGQLIQQQGPIRELIWDYSEWQPILTPCETCKEARVLEGKVTQITNIPFQNKPKQVPNAAPEQQDTSSVIQLQPIFTIKPPKTTKPNLTKAPLVVSQPPSTPAITFPPKSISKNLTPIGESSIRGGEVHLVYLPEGSIRQLSAANAARIVPTSQAPNQIQSNIDAGPPPPSPEAIQIIDFSDKQKRDHKGHIVSGGATNTLPMSLITAHGHEADAKEKLKLLEAALATPIEQEEDGKLPRVFIAPSHVPPPPGYVKIPLVPQGKPHSQEIAENGPLPSTFLSPDTRNPPPGFVKFDLPSAVSHLSKDIPVVVPNSQVEPNLIFNGPSFASTPGPIRPDASLNFQTRNVRTGKNIISNISPVQAIPKDQPNPTLSTKPPSPPTQAVSKPRPHINQALQFPPRPILQQSIPFAPHNSVQPGFPPRQPLPQQFQPNPSQARPFVPQAGQRPITVFPNQPISQLGQFQQPGQNIPQPQPPFQRPGQPFQSSVPQPGQNFFQQNVGHRFIQPNQNISAPRQTFQRPIPPLQHINQPNQLHNQPIQQPFFQPGQTSIQFQRPGQPFPQQRPSNAHPNQSIFTSPHAHIQPDFPEIDISLTEQHQNPSFPRNATVIPQSTSSRAHFSSPFPTTFSPITTTPQPLSSTILDFSPHPKSFTQFSSSPFSHSSPRPTPFIQASPRPNSITQRPVFSPRITTPEFASSPSPIPLIPQSSPRPFSQTPIPHLTPRPLLETSTIPIPSRHTFASSQSSQFPSSPRPLLTTPQPIPSSTLRPLLITPQSIPSSTSRPLLTSPEPILSSNPRPLLSSQPPRSSTPRPQLLTFTPRPITNTSPDFSNTPRTLFQATNSAEFTFQEQQNADFNKPQFPSFQEQSFQKIPSFQEPKFPQIPSFQEPQFPPPSSQEEHIPHILTTQEPLTPQVPSFQRPLRTRFPGQHSPRIPSFQRSTSVRTPITDNTEEEEKPRKRLRLPILPRLQGPRITTLAPEDEDQTLIPEFTTTDFITQAPESHSPTASPPLTTTTVKVTTFKPKFDFNVGVRRPIIRKLRPTEAVKKEPGEKKTETSTLFPPFSVARTLNPHRNANQEANESNGQKQSSVPEPPAEVFGRRLRPRTKAPAVTSDDDTESTRPTGLRSRGLVGNRVRQLPDWLKERRRVRGRFRGPTTTTENVNVLDTALEDDIPLDILENNGFSGAESIQVVVSSRPENSFSPVNPDETDKTVNINDDILRTTKITEPAHSDTNANQAQDTHQLEQEEDSEIELNLTSTAEEILKESQGQETLYEDYSIEKTEVLPEPEPEPTNKYVDDYDEFKDDNEDTPQTHPTPDQPQEQPPSFPNPQPAQHAIIHTSAHSYPYAKVPLNPPIKNSEIIPLDTAIDYQVDEVDDATERYVGHLNSDENELISEPSFDSETDTLLSFDTEVKHEDEIERVTESANISQELNDSVYNNDTHHLEGEGEEGAVWGMEGESPEQREDSYQEYRTESPELSILFPNDYFTALSPGKLQDYDYYEYDTYVDNDYMKGLDQDFGGSSAQVVFAVPVTEYYSEVNTFQDENTENESEREKEPLENLDNVVPTTEAIAILSTDGIETEYEYGTTTDLPLDLETEPITESLLEVEDTTLAYDNTSEISKDEGSTAYAAIATSTTEKPQARNESNLATPTTTVKPLSKRPLHERLQNIGTKAEKLADKNLVRMPKILGQSTVTEIRSSDPIICFRNDRCIRARSQRNRRSNKP